MPRHPSVLQNAREFQEKGLWNPPQEMSRFVYALNNPTFAPADKSLHMRDDDYVVAFAYRGVARAYPVWIVDYYHAINDAVRDEPVIVFS